MMECPMMVDFERVGHLGARRDDALERATQSPQLDVWPGALEVRNESGGMAVSHAVTIRATVGRGERHGPPCERQDGPCGWERWAVPCRA
jgi:hypothetical protein